MSISTLAFLGDKKEEIMTRYFLACRAGFQTEPFLFSYVFTATEGEALSRDMEDEIKMCWTFGGVDRHHPIRVLREGP